MLWPTKRTNVPSLREVPTSEASRKIAPGNAGTTAMQRRIYETTVIGGGDANRPGAAG